jgi:uncharacterized damage-inducible protein DinB
MIRMRRFRELRSAPGFAPEIGRRVAALETSRLATILQIEGLGPEHLAWSPGAGVNTIGTLLTHIAESEAFWIVERIGGRPLPATRREIYRMDLFGSPRAPQAPRAPASYFVGLLSDLRAESREVLAALADEDLDGRRVWTDPERSDEQEIFTVRWALDHVLVHEAHHGGQIAFLRRLLGAPPAPRLDDVRVPAKGGAP